MSCNPSKKGRKEMNIEIDKPQLMGNSHQEINMKLYFIKMLKEQIKDIENILPEGVLE